MKVKSVSKIQNKTKKNNSEGEKKTGKMVVSLACSSYFLPHFDLAASTTLSLILHNRSAYR